MTEAELTGRSGHGGRMELPGPVRTMSYVAAPLVVAGGIAAWSIHAGWFLFFIILLLLACLAMSAIMAFYWREWRALPLSLVFALLAGTAWISALIHAGSAPRDGGLALLGEILLLASVPVAFGALAGLWRIFENQARFQRGQRDLIEYEARYRHLIESATDAFYAADTNGRFTLVNESAARLFGRRVTDLITLSLFDVVDDETARKVREALEVMSVKDIRSSYHEFEIIRRDKSRRWVGQNLQLLRVGREIRGFQSVLRDITDRRVAEEALQQSEARLRTLFDTLSEGVLQTRADGYIVFCNPAAERILGVNASVITSRHCADPAWVFAKPGGVPMPVEEWVAFRVHRENRSIPRTVAGVRAGDGSMVWLSAGAEPIQGNDGSLQGAVVTFADITKSKVTEENLQIIEFALDSAREHVFLATREGRLVYANKSAMAALGVEPAEILGLTIFDIATEITPNDWAETWQQARNGAWPTFESRFVARGGRTYPASTSASHVEFNGTEYLFAFSRDLSWETELATQLRHAQKLEAIGTLAGAIAHDFNNILSGVLGYAELALRDTPAESRIHPFLEEIMAGGNRAADLVRQILTFSRRGEHRQQPLLMAPVVKEALKLLRGSLPATIAIHESIDPGCGPVMGDPGQIHQVMMNLCTNAYHAMRDCGGTIAVSLREVEAGTEWTCGEFCLKPGRYVELSVSDTGCGMDAETRQRIFDPFFTTKKPGEGTGLGLSTVHGIVKSCKGGIRVQSEPGKGTRFDILLPLCQRATELACQEAPGTPSPGGQETVLLVDDESAITGSMGEGLRGLGYTVETAANGRAALARFETGPERFDLVISDHTMPELTGFEMARRMLRLRPSQKIILCTGFEEGLSREMVLGSGVADFLPKPYTVSSLARLVRAVLDGARPG